MRVPKAWVVPLLLLVGGMFASEWSARAVRDRLQQQAREHVLMQAAELRSQLESALASTMFLAQGLAAYVRGVEQLSEPEVTRAMRAIHDADPRIRNVGIAPDNVLRFVYPLEGNEKALGLRFSDVPEQWPGVRKAIELRRSVLVGPVQLVQGGVGIICRTPVFRDDGSYWGLLSVVIDLPRLLRDVGFRAQADGVHYWLYGDVAQSGEPPLIAGSNVPRLAHAVRMNIQVPNNQCRLYAQAADPAQTPSDIWLLRGVLYLITALLAGFTAMLITSRTTTARMAQQMARLNGDLLRTNAHLERLSKRDPLTQLYNRRAFDEAMRGAWNTAARNNLSLAVLVIDIDHFKSINDRFGHAVGDATLVEVSAAILAEARRGDDVVARYGGEEFIVLALGLQADAALHLAERIRVAASECRVHLPGEIASEERVTVSVGVAVRIPEPRSLPETLIARADRALYRAKAEGRNRVRLADPIPEPANAERQVT